MSRSGSKIPSYGGTHQERHLHAVRPERRSGVSRIVCPPYIPSAEGGGSCACGSAVGRGTHVSSGGGSTPANAAVGARWRSMHVRFVTNLRKFTQRGLMQTLDNQQLVMWT